MGNPTVTPIQENWHPGGFIVTEARGTLSRDTVTLASGTLYLAGTVLGRRQSGATAAAAAIGVNTGNGTFGTITVGTAATPGVYAIEFDSATNYIVSSPAGVEIGHGATGAAFSGGGLGFTITAGGTAFAAADSFTVTVTGGSWVYATFDPTQTDGTQNAAAILYGQVDATTVARKGSVIARNSEVNASELVWGANVTTAGQQTAALAQLASTNIISR